MRPKLLDLYCGGGGASRGYQLAGFDVTGVDVVDHSRYYQGDTFVQADALEYLAEHGHRFVAVHASPVCKRYAVCTPEDARESHPDQVAGTRELLLASGKPWVMENVPGAPLRQDLMLCGSHFGLVADGWLLKRHRLFELGGFSAPQPVCDCKKWVGYTASVTGNVQRSGFNHYRPRSGVTFPLVQAQQVMGIVLPSKALVQAVPVAYTEYIGKFLAETLGV